MSNITVYHTRDLAKLIELCGSKSTGTFYDGPKFHNTFRKPIPGLDSFIHFYLLGFARASGLPHSEGLLYFRECISWDAYSSPRNWCVGGVGDGESVGHVTVDAGFSYPEKKSPLCPVDSDALLYNLAVEKEKLGIIPGHFDAILTNFDENSAEYSAVTEELKKRLGIEPSVVKRSELKDLIGRGNE